MALAWFHCFSGIAGDMALGALLDAGADVDEVRDVVARLPVSRLGTPGRGGAARRPRAPPAPSSTRRRTRTTTARSPTSARCWPAPTCPTGSAPAPWPSSPHSPRRRADSTACRPTRSTSTRSAPSTPSSTSSGRAPPSSCWTSTRSAPVPSRSASARCGPPTACCPTRRPRSSPSSPAAGIPVTGVDHTGRAGHTDRCRAAGRAGRRLRAAATDDAGPHRLRRRRAGRGGPGQRRPGRDRDGDAGAAEVALSAPGQPMVAAGGQRRRRLGRGARPHRGRAARRRRPRRLDHPDRHEEGPARPHGARVVRPGARPGPSARSSSPRRARSGCGRRRSSAGRRCARSWSSIWTARPCG